MTTSNNFNVEQIVLMEWIDSVTSFFEATDNKIEDHFMSKSIVLQNLLKTIGFEKETLNDIVNDIRKEIFSKQHC